MGRKSTFDQAKADQICERLAKGEPLAVICRDDAMPQYRTVYDWADANEAFAANIARAREDGHEAIGADCLTIADNANGDTQRDKLRVETRLKLLAKWSPKKYGDKLELEHSGELTVLDPVSRQAEIARLLEKRNAVGG
jgi:hypothetical protein